MTDALSAPLPSPFPRRHMPETSSSFTLQDPAPQAAPPGFVHHAYEDTFTSEHARDVVWDWLCNPRTFTESQLWPYRVEFVDPDTGAPAGFREGVLTAHHGPGISFAGRLTEIRPGAYRDLQYFYGSYAFSLRLIRPTRLQFWCEDAPGGGTEVSVRLDSFVRPALVPLWAWGQRTFMWDRLPNWMDRSLSA